MPGKSKLTADAAEQAALRGLSKSEQRGEADRARAILLTLEGGGTPGRSPRFSEYLSARGAIGGGNRPGVPRRIRGAHASLSGALLGAARIGPAHRRARPGEETGQARGF